MSTVIHALLYRFYGSIHINIVTFTDGHSLAFNSRSSSGFGQCQAGTAGHIIDGVSCNLLHETMFLLVYYN